VEEVERWRAVGNNLRKGFKQFDGRGNVKRV
jgi:hypothetical protein